MNATVLKMPEPVKQVKATTFREVGHAYNEYTVTVPVDWTPDDVLVPEAWSQIAGMVAADSRTGRPAQTGSLIHVRTEDHAFYSLLYIRAVRKMALDVEVLLFKELGPQGDVGNQTYKTRWNVGARGFDIIRKADDVIVGAAKDFPKKEDAMAWIDKMKA